MHQSLCSGSSLLCWKPSICCTKPQIVKKPQYCAQNFTLQKSSILCTKLHIVKNLQNDAQNFTLQKTSILCTNLHIAKKINIVHKTFHCNTDAPIVLMRELIALQKTFDMLNKTLHCKEPSICCTKLYTAKHWLQCIRRCTNPCVVGVHWSAEQKVVFRYNNR